MKNTKPGTAGLIQRNGEASFSIRVGERPVHHERRDKKAGHAGIHPAC